GRSARPMSTYGILKKPATGTNLGVSKRTLLTCGYIACASALVASNTVPSGGDVYTMSEPIDPPAPVLFSTYTVCPRRVCMPSATSRAATSVPPPGGNGTTILIGFAGFQ